MARAKVTHSGDSVQVTFNGDVRSPEPSTGIIKFPGGWVEVTRCSDGTYWAHLEVAPGATVHESRIDRHAPGGGVVDVVDCERVTQIALRLSGSHEGDE
jgi:hypothetical protein